MVPGVANTTDGRLRRKDGTTFPVEARVAVFRSEGQKLVLALVRDITERKRAEEALQQTHEQLEARVRERTAELARANSVQVEALEALRRSELRIARMTANVPGMVYQLLLHADGTANFPYVSEGCRELFGLEPAQMRPDACTLLDLIHPEDIGAFLSTLDESKNSGAAWAWEGRYVTGAGKETRWLQGTARPERQDERHRSGTACCSTSPRASAPNRASRTAPARPPPSPHWARARLPSSNHVGLAEGRRRGRHQHARRRDVHRHRTAARRTGAGRPRRGRLRPRHHRHDLSRRAGIARRATPSSPGSR